MVPCDECFTHGQQILYSFLEILLKFLIPLSIKFWDNYIVFTKKKSILKLNIVPHMLHVFCTSILLHIRKAQYMDDKEN